MTTTENDGIPDEVTVAHTLPGMALPEYHGRTPSKMKTGVTGASNRISIAHEIGTTVVLVLEAKVVRAGHEQTDDGLTYVEGLKVTDLFELQAAQGRRLLSAVRSAHRSATEGALPIPEQGATYPTDGSGVIVTPADALTIGDDPLVSALTDETKTPVVVVYSDGARELWPDEFDADEERPKPGDRFDSETGAEVYVAEILDALTGTRVGAWSEADEDARLLEEERKAIAAEEAEERGEPLEEDRTLSDEELAADLEAGREILGDRADELAEVVDFPGIAGDPPDDEVEVDAPAEQVDPPEANEDLDGDPAETFPGSPDGDGETFGEIEKAFIDRKIEEIRPDVPLLGDRDEVLRMLACEEAGRGRGLKPRAGVLELLNKRAAELFTSEIPAGPPPPAPAGFEPPESADEWED